jgi:tartrate dehydratase beta subunit/fumarate hydratase class I family protein
MHKLTVPISEEAIRELKAGDPVSLNGVIVTGDAAYKIWILSQTRQPPAAEKEMWERPKRCQGKRDYHCGPVVQQKIIWRFVAADQHQRSARNLIKPT